MLRKLSSVFVASLVGIILIVPFTLKVSADDSYSSQESVTGNKYSAGKDVNETKDIKGDLYTMGQSVKVMGKVDDNAMILGGEVLVDKSVGNDVDIAGYYVVINGNISGDLRVAAQELYINSSYIAGDLYVTANEIHISSDTQILGEEKLNSGMIYRDEKSNPIDLSDSNFNASNIDFKFDSKASLAGLTILTGVIGIIGIIGSIISGYFVLRVFPVFSENVLKTMKSRWLLSTGIGCLVMLLAPVLAILLLFSVLGWNLLVLLAVLCILTLILSSTYVRYITGRLIFKAIGKPNVGRLLTLVVGVLVFEIVMFIIGVVPVLGVLVSFMLSVLFAAWGVGSIILSKLSPEKK